MSLSLFLIFIFYSSFCFSSETIVIKEGDIFKLVQDNNNLVKSRLSEIKSQESKTGSVTRSFFPDASVFAGQESYRYVADHYKTEPYFGAQVQMNLYNGGRDSIQGELIHSVLDQNQANLKVTLFEQVEGARKSFWNILYLKQLVDEYKQALILININKQAAIKRISGGVATNSDKFEFEIKSVEIDQDLRRTQLLLDKEIGHFKILAGLKNEAALTFSQDLEHDHNWRKFFSHSEAEHGYLLRPQQIEVEKSKINAKLSGRAWLPKVDTYALWLQNNQRQDYDRINKHDRQQTALGLKATWSFSDFIEGRVGQKSNQALTESNNMKLAFQRQNLENELHFELKELELLDGMVHDAEENVDRSNQFFKLISNEYKRGVKTSGDMLMATEKLVQSKIRKMNIVKDFQFAKSHVMTKLGQ